MRYVREPDVITAEPKATTRIRLYWRGNSDVALDGAGVKPPRVIIWIRDNVRSQLIEDPSLTTKAVHKVVHKYNKSGTQSHHRVL